MELQHILRSQQFDLAMMYRLFERASYYGKLFQNGSSCYEDTLAGKILLGLFYEPSTRTRLSFAMAGHHLGMKVEITENAKDFSSAIKGESIEDTIRVIGGYRPAVIVIRHPEEGAAERAAAVSAVPIINAGDGCGQHPTQALLDVYTIYNAFGELEGLNITIGGDLAHGRTVRSLVYLMSKFKGVSFDFISPQEFRIGDDIKEYLKRHGVGFTEQEGMSAIARADVVYWTRIQKERMPTGIDFTEIENKYVIGAEQLSQIKKDAIIMHPLPRVKEISIEVDSDPRAEYFKQSDNGMLIRMALLHLILK